MIWSLFFWINLFTFHRSLVMCCLISCHILLRSISLPLLSSLPSSPENSTYESA